MIWTRDPTSSVAPSAWALTAASLLAAALAVPVDAKVSLQGRALSAGGKPVPGTTVYIYTARPREGTSSLCPSCYPDCGKVRRAGGNGRFVVPGLSDSLLFRVLFCAPGWEPVFADTVDPHDGPIEVRMRPRDLSRVDRARAVHGRVVGRDGSPVVGAIVEPAGYRTPDGRMAFGSALGADPIAVSDQRGEFVLAGNIPNAAWFLQVKGRDFAPRAFEGVLAGKDTATLEVGPGAIVSGEVWRDGRPVPGAVVGLGSASRLAGTLSVYEEIATDDRGRFAFLNVAPRAPFVVSGKWGALGDGTIGTHPLTSAADDSTTHVGRLEIRPGHRITGRVALTDGKPLPAGLRLNAARDQLLDVQQIPLPPDGRFELRGVPAEVLNLGLRIPGYRLSPRTVGYGGYAGVWLGVDRDFEDLEILFEPGDDGWGPPPAAVKP